MLNKALVIDDDEATLELMRFQLESEGFGVVTANRGTHGLELAEAGEFDIILTDLNLPDINGIDMVRRCKQTSPETEVIMITGFGSTHKAVEATKAGAFYYVEKPVEFEDLLVLIDKAIDRKRQAVEIRELRERLSSRTSYEGIIGGSRAMQDIYELIDSVAESDASILILGESGTGKEVIANAIHYKSLRAKKAFVKLNCSALPKELIESELFGHKKGAFTGATSEKTGFLGRADGGSILLDEIGEMPPSLQPKLLRVLQDQVYFQVGSDQPREADFRLISATNLDPFEAIRQGNLREDLYYRINTIEIKIPPLRDRMDDVPMLAEHFLQAYGAKYNKRSLAFSERAYDQMLNYGWRGNVRELQHVIERAVLLSKKGQITDLKIPKDVDDALSFERLQGLSTPEDADSNLLNDSNSVGLLTGAFLSEDELFERIGKFIVDRLPSRSDGHAQRDIFNELENVVVRAALQKTNGNKQAAANLLGLYRPRLYGIIKRHNLSRDA